MVWRLPIYPGDPGGCASNPCATLRGSRRTCRKKYENSSEILAKRAFCDARNEHRHARSYERSRAVNLSPHVVLRLISATGNPDDPASHYKEVTATALCSPDRRMQRNRAIEMRAGSPLRPILRDQTERNCFAATARAPKRSTPRRRRVADQVDDMCIGIVRWLSYAPRPDRRRAAPKLVSNPSDEIGEHLMSPFWRLVRPSPAAA